MVRWLAAILTADMVGYTWLVAADEPGPVTVFPEVLNIT